MIQGDVVGVYKMHNIGNFQNAFQYSRIKTFYSLSPGTNILMLLNDFIMFISLL